MTAVRRVGRPPTRSDDIQCRQSAARSLAKLSEHLTGLGITLCEETLRQTLGTAGLSHQRTRLWKWSSDPEFAEKAQRVLALFYSAKPDDGAVVCFDEMGPIQLIPHAGSGCAPENTVSASA